MIFAKTPSHSQAFPNPFGAQLSIIIDVFRKMGVWELFSDTCCARVFNSLLKFSVRIINAFKLPYSLKSKKIMEKRELACLDCQWRVWEWLGVSNG